MISRLVKDLCDSLYDQAREHPGYGSGVWDYDGWGVVKCEYLGLTSYHISKGLIWGSINLRENLNTRIPLSWTEQKALRDARNAFIIGTKRRAEEYAEFRKEEGLQERKR